MRYGYVRVSTAGQNTARQEIMMAELGVDRMFVDHASGKNMDRPGYAELMAALQPGDTVIVESYSRMSRSVGDLLDTVARLNDMGVAFVSKKENLDTTTAAGRLMLTVFAGLNAFEREVMLERQREGIDAMKVVNGVRVSLKSGKTYGRKVTEVEGIDEVRREVEEGRISVTEGCRRLGISRSKWYRMNERSE